METDENIRVGAPLGLQVVEKEREKQRAARGAAVYASGRTTRALASMTSFSGLKLMNFGKCKM